MFELNQTLVFNLRTNREKNAIKKKNDITNLKKYNILFDNIKRSFELILMSEIDPVPIWE